MGRCIFVVAIPQCAATGRAIAVDSECLPANRIELAVDPYAINILPLGTVSIITLCPTSSFRVEILVPPPVSRTRR
jgi:hypothetical protein